MDTDILVIGRFFKILLPGRFETSLTLPPDFTKKLKLNLGVNHPNKAVVMSCKGSWEIDVTISSNGYLNLSGESWKRYVSDHELNIGDFIVFEHTRLFRFTTFVFDHENGCHKNFDASEDSGDGDDEHVRVINDVGQEETHNGSSQDMNTQFRTSISKFNISGIVYVPAAFARSNGLCKNGAVTMRDAATGDSWVCHISIIKGVKPRVRLRTLSEFFKRNKLKVGDECIFKLHQHVSKNQKNVVMDAHFLRM